MGAVHLLWVFKMVSLDSIHTIHSDLTVSAIPFRFFIAISLSFIYFHFFFFNLTECNHHVILAFIAPAQILHLNSLWLL